MRASVSHAPTSYEWYLLHERERYGWEANEKNDFPAWLVLELETYDWMFSLCCQMYHPWENHIISKHMLARIEAIPNIRFLRYRDISPSLKKSISDIAEEFASLRDDLKKPEMWKQSCLISRDGFTRWKKATKIVSNSLNAIPDPLWRENWEKERVHPCCTRLEAEILASDYLLQQTGIDLYERDPDSGKDKYHVSRNAKDGFFKMRFDALEKLREPFHDYGVVEVNMLSREIKIVYLDN